MWLASVKMVLKLSYFSRVLLPEKFSGEFIIFSKFSILRIVSLIEWRKSDDKGQERLLLAKKGKWLIMTENFSVFGFLLKIFGFRFCWKYFGFRFCWNAESFSVTEKFSVFLGWDRTNDAELTPKPVSAPHFRFYRIGAEPNLYPWAKGFGFTIAQIEVWSDPTKEPFLNATQILDDQTSQDCESSQRYWELAR